MLVLLFHAVGFPQTAGYLWWTIYIYEWRSTLVRTVAGMSFFYSSVCPVLQQATLWTGGAECRFCGTGLDLSIGSFSVPCLFTYLQQLYYWSSPDGYSTLIRKQFLALELGTSITVNYLVYMKGEQRTTGSVTHWQSSKVTTLIAAPQPTFAPTICWLWIQSLSGALPKKVSPTSLKSSIYILADIRDFGLNQYTVLLPNMASG